MKNRNKVLLSAAIAGLLAGATTQNALADHHEKKVEPSNSDVKDGCAGKDNCKDDVKGTPVATPKAEKDDCKSKEAQETQRRIKDV